MIVIKHDGRSDIFDGGKIKKAILKAANACGEIIKDSSVVDIILAIKTEIKNESQEVHVNDIHNLVENKLKEGGYTQIANCYMEYRKERTNKREENSKLLQALNKITEKDDRGAGSNANVGNNFSAKLLKLASEGNKTKNIINMPKKFAKRHECGDWHVHDLDSYDLAPNCLQIQTGEVLSKGFNPGYGLIKPAKRLSSAAILSCIILQSSQNFN